MVVPVKVILKVSVSPPSSVMLPSVLLMAKSTVVVSDSVIFVVTLEVLTVAEPALKSCVPNVGIMVSVPSTFASS